MIIGIGVDVVDVPRFQAAIIRSPGLSARLFTAEELRQTGGRGHDAVSQAARFAAKEAVAKTLGAPAGLRWHDCEILLGDRGKPYLAFTGTVAAAAAEVHAQIWHLSLSHDGDVAMAFVIAERSPAAG